MSELAQVPAKDTLRLERLLPGPIERIWEYLVDEQKRSQWFAGGPMEPRVGGVVQLVFDHDKISGEPYPERFRKHKGAREEGKVLRYEPPRTLAYTFAGNSEVTFELTPKGSDVLLVLTHRKVASVEHMTSFSSGWHAHVDVLEDILRERERRQFWSNFARLEAEYTRILLGKSKAA